MKKENSKSTKRVKKSIFIAILALWILPETMLFAQGRRLENRGRQEYQIQSKHYYGSPDIVLAPKAVVTRTWVKSYPYNFQYDRAKRGKIYKQRLHELPKFRMVRIHGRKFYVAHGHYFIKRRGNFIRVKSPRGYRG